MGRKRKSKHVRISSLINVPNQDEINPELENLIYQELTLHRKLSLSIGLPFDKTVEHRLKGVSLFEFRSLVAAKLTWTYHREEWFHNAFRLDVERRTRLGTLGYLPFEIRQQIWKYVVEHERQYYARRDNRIYPVTGFRPLRVGPQSGVRLNRLSWNLQHASADIAFEIDRTFLSTFTVMVSRAQHLTELLNRLQTIEPRSIFRLQVRFSNETDYLVRYKGDNAWTRAFKKLPPTLIFVQFMIATNERDTMHELWLLDALVKAVAEKSPQALSTWGWLDSKSPQISLDQRAAFKSCFTPETNPIWHGPRVWASGIYDY